MKKILTLFFMLVGSLSFSLNPPMTSFVVTSPIGYRSNPFTGETDFHQGIDIVGPKGSPILAAGDGIVVEHWLPPGTVGWNGKTYQGHPYFGGMIMIDHGNGLWTLYGHMSKTFVHEGMKVKAGQIIGIQGHTGMATGDHLHFEVRVNPILFFPKDLIIPVAEEARRMLKE